MSNFDEINRKIADLLIIVYSAQLDKNGNDLIKNTDDEIILISLFFKRINKKN